MTFVWTSRHGHSADLTKCRASVPEKSQWGWLHNHQCSKKPTCEREIEGNTYGFCSTHDPEAVRKRSEARMRTYQTKARFEVAKLKLEQAAPAMKLALERIRDGHNDPRSLAVEILDGLGTAP